MSQVNIFLSGLLFTVAVLSVAWGIFVIAVKLLLKARGNIVRGEIIDVVKKQESADMAGSFVTDSKYSYTVSYKKAGEENNQTLSSRLLRNPKYEAGDSVNVVYNSRGISYSYIDLASELWRPSIYYIFAGFISLGLFLASVTWW